ncbi:SRPBCC family protein [Mycobacterium sp. M1]|uniref:SRPBCC family protein n=1 Tax=Mycolicibacter acidiphilus TaxID=2835306 RepID=A0ABS5RLD9_9MYCO|nr:SRPBCC family protein [Mycolicibacter acidiphilus]MBS9534807.1 SRPBCC family protein [Mycolicibacter acidiphilus]
MADTTPTATGTVQINAAPEAVYTLITDLAALADCAEENVGMDWRKGDSALPGAVFVGHNRNGGRRWSTTCTITDADPGKAFAFDVRSAVIPVARWEYRITPTGGGCQVTESMWDRRPGWFVGIAGLVTGVKDRPTVNAEHIRLTLERVKQRAETTG